MQMERNPCPADNTWKRVNHNTNLKSARQHVAKGINFSTTNTLILQSSWTRMNFWKRCLRFVNVLWHEEANGVQQIKHGNG